MELDFPSLAASRLVPYNSDDDDDDDDNDEDGDDKNKGSGAGLEDNLQQPAGDSVAVKEERERLRKEASLKPCLLYTSPSPRD